MPLLHHAVLRLVEVTHDVVVVLPPDAEPPVLPPGVPVRYVHDAVEGQGPLEGALSGLSSVADRVRGAGGRRHARTLHRGGDRDAAGGRRLGGRRRGPAGRRTSPSIAARGARRARSRGRARAPSRGRAPPPLVAAGVAHRRDRRGHVARSGSRTAGPSGTSTSLPISSTPRHRLAAMSHVEPFRVGDVEIAVLCQGWAPLPLADESPGHDVDWAEERRAFPWAFDGDAHWQWHVQAFIVRTPSGVTMVDTGLGGNRPVAPWAPGQGMTADQAYEDAGVDPSEVSTVVLTHMHPDHSGGIRGTTASRASPTPATSCTRRTGRSWPGTCPSSPRWHGRVCTACTSWGCWTWTKRPRGGPRDRGPTHARPHPGPSQRAGPRWRRGHAAHRRSPASCRSSSRTRPGDRATTRIPTPVRDHGPRSCRPPPTAAGPWACRISRSRSAR